MQFMTKKKKNRRQIFYQLSLFGDKGVAGNVPTCNQLKYVKVQQPKRDIKPIKKSITDVRTLNLKKHMYIVI